MSTWTHQLIEVLISGVTSGALYAVIGIGLSLVYGISRVFNFAYGSFFIWGGYLAWLVVGVGHFGYGVVFITVIPAMFLLGFLSERVTVRPLRWKPKWDMTTMMSTLGLAIFLDNLVLVSFGPLKKSLPPLFKGTIHLGDFVLTTNEAAVFAIAIAAIILLGIFLSKARLGMAMRATSQDIAGAQIMGIPINRIFSFTFALSAVLVGIGAILLAPKIILSPLGGWDILVKAFVIITLGGLGSIKGTLYAAFILGLVEALVGLYIGMTWVMVVWFMVLLGVLIIRPRGLFGVWG